MLGDRLPELPLELKSLEVDLAALAPASGGLNRDELMYRAGWAACEAAVVPAGTPAQSNQRRMMVWLWPLTTAGLVLLSATLGIALATREPPLVVITKATPPDRKSEANKDASDAAPAMLPAGSEPIAMAWSSIVRPTIFDRSPAPVRDDYLSLRDRVLAFGVDALPSYAAATPPNDARADGQSRYGTLMGQLLGG